MSNQEKISKPIPELVNDLYAEFNDYHAEDFRYNRNNDLRFNKFEQFLIEKVAELRHVLNLSAEHSMKLSKEISRLKSEIEEDDFADV